VNADVQNPAQRLGLRSSDRASLCVRDCSRSELLVLHGKAMISQHWIPVRASCQCLMSAGDWTAWSRRLCLLGEQGTALPLLSRLSAAVIGGQALLDLCYRCHPLLGCVSLAAQLKSIGLLHVSTCVFSYRSARASAVRVRHSTASSRTEHGGTKRKQCIKKFERRPSVTSRLSCRCTTGLGAAQQFGSTFGLVPGR
jgi:hypothetical protein